MIPKEVLALIGKESSPVEMEVEKGAIKRYAAAVGEANPLYLDYEYAKKSKYRNIIAPPGFFGWPAKGATGGMQDEEVAELRGAFAKAGYPRILDGGQEYEYYAPVRAGDTLTAKRKIADMYEKDTKGGGKLMFIIAETTYINQNGVQVAKMRQTWIGRP